MNYENTDIFKDIAMKTLVEDYLNKILQSFKINKEDKKPKIDKNKKMENNFEGNIALAYITGCFEMNNTCYFALSNVNTKEQYKPESVPRLNHGNDEVKIKICLANEKEKIKRLNTYLNFQEDNDPNIKENFAYNKRYCCERKIFQHIKADLYEYHFNKDSSERCTIYIYTKYEPCMYCYQFMTEFLSKYNKSYNDKHDKENNEFNKILDVQLYYDQIYYVGD